MKSKNHWKWKYILTFLAWVTMTITVNRITSVFSGALSIAARVPLKSSEVTTCPSLVLVPSLSECWIWRTTELPVVMFGKMKKDLHPAFKCPEQPDVQQETLWLDLEVGGGLNPHPPHSTPVASLFFISFLVRALSLHHFDFCSCFFPSLKKNSLQLVLSSWALVSTFFHVCSRQVRQVMFVTWKAKIVLFFLQIPCYHVVC